MIILPEGSTLKGWIQSPLDDKVHVHPDDDLKEHDLTTTCWCRPVLDEGYIVIHNSLDRREDYDKHIH